ncbi:MAG: matrixin family metalloprotease [Hyphomicrobiaceae bacterium]
MRGGLTWAALCGAIVLATSTCAAAEPAAYKVLTLGGFPVRWMPGKHATELVLRYRIADQAVEQPGAINCKRMRPPASLLGASGITVEAFRHALSAAFQRWRDVADIVFVEAGAGQRADIVIGEQAEPQGYAFTNLDLATETEGGVRAIVGASICLNPKRHWKIGYDGNVDVYDLVHTFAHEIGHVIGLDHPSGRGHLMSFRYSELHDGLSQGDRMGAIALYGPSRLRSQTAALPDPTGDGGSARITTTLGRSIDGASAN